jgi:hypothetical protein
VVKRTVNLSISSIIKISFAYLQKLFSIEEENLYEKYVEGEIEEDKTLMSLLTWRNQIMEGNIKILPGGPATILNVCALYCLIRHFGLTRVFETGVSAGFSTAFVLAALRQNDPENSYLTSVDLCDDDGIGIVVPEEYKSNLRLIKGIESVKYMKENNCRNYELYCHDSLHTFQYMSEELLEFKKCILPRFFVFYDDRNADDFWNKSMDMNMFHKAGYKAYSLKSGKDDVWHALGGMIKYEKI